MFENEAETLKLLEWLSKAINGINWFTGGVATVIIVAQNINESKCIKHWSYSCITRLQNMLKNANLESLS